MCKTWLLSLQMSYTRTYIETCARQLLRYAESKKSSLHIPHCFITVCSLFFLFFLCFSFYSSVFLYRLYIPASLPIFHTLLCVQDGKSSCSRLPSQCLMECCSLWPLAVWLCTPCTCPWLTSNSTIHIHSLSHSVTHRNPQTYTSGSNTHSTKQYTHKPN